MILTIGKKIALGFAAALVALLIVGGASRENLFELNDDAFWVTHTVEVQSHLEGMRAGFTKAESAARGFAITSDPVFQGIVGSSFMHARDEYKALRFLVQDNPVQEARLDQIDPLLTSREAQLRRLTEGTSLTQATKAEVVTLGEQTTAILDKHIADMVAEEQRLLGLRQQRAASMAARTSNTLIYGTVTAILVVSFLGFFLAKSITDPIATLGRGAAKIGSGDYTHRVSVQTSGEVARLAELFNRMAAQIEERQAVLAEQEWLKSGLAAFSELFQGQRDITELCRRVLAMTADLTPARRSALYLIPADDEPQFLKLVAGSADEAGGKWAPGSGFPGQCWRDKTRIIVRDVPRDYFRIGSGLGEAAPTMLLLLPAVYEGRVRAVIELASWRAFTEVELTLLDRLAESLAIDLTTLEASALTELLLRRSQALASTLQDRTDKLLASEVQLKEQQEELKQTNEELEQANEEMEQTNEEMEEKVNLLAEQKRSMEEANGEIRRSRADLEEKARQLAIASKYKSEFLANMSHELRTPLNSLMILSKLLADNPDGGLSEKQVQYARTIHSSGSDLLDLINEILDLARIEAGAVRVDLSMVSMAEIADFTERTFRHMADENKVQFDIRMDPGLPKAVETDERRLKQVLKNLLSNAFKFTQRGSVVLAGRPGPGPAEVTFSVTDTGIGIAREKQDLIFEAFQQADAGTARKYGGTGLGLTISRELASLLGGELRMTSEEGKGSTFEITVPLEPKARAERQPSRAPAPQRQPEAVQSEEPADEPDRIPDDRGDIQPGDRVLLVVDDDRNFSQLMIEFARDKKFKVVRTGSARQGFNLAVKLLPSAITLDLRLPDGDGWLILDRLKHDPRTRHIPTHIISVDHERERGLRQGAVSVLQKPVTKATIDDAFQQTIDLINRPIKNLLIVEDDATQRKALIDLIGNGDVKSEGVGSAAETFEALGRKHFDCIVLDLGLPDMNGFDLIREIQRRFGKLAPPVVVYTGRELSRDEDTELRMISDSVVIKNARSPERLLDETALFLHRVESRMPQKKQRILELAKRNDSVLAGRSVLVVDDDVRNIFALTAVLEEVGMKVEYAESGKTALEKLAANPKFDAILMDVMMPDMDGFETTRRIRSMDRFRKLPIIAVTAKAMKGDREKCLEAGASDFITKPVDMEQLRSLLRVWLYA